MSDACALVRSCHPLPSLAVTACATVLAIAAGNTVGVCVLLAAAVLAGQLSVGWSNDRIDARRDRRVGHPGKPVAAGQLSARAVDVAIAISAAGAVALSLSLGWRAGVVHLAAVAVAWLYNAWLKGTVLSWLPYTLAFGALPAVATLTLAGHPLPHGWVLAVAALLGTAVNFVNAVPALADDPRSDVHGLPDRLGGRGSLVLAAALMSAAAALVTWFPAGAPRTMAWAGLGLVGALLAAGLRILWRVADSRLPFYWLLAVVPVVLLVLVLTARPLH